MDGHQLKVVNSYPYLGYKFTTKLSVSKGLQPVTVRAKRKLTGILKAYWRNG